MRFGALAVDFPLFCAMFLPITQIAKGVWFVGVNDHRGAQGWVVFDPICAIFLAIIFLYFVCLEGLVAATLGK